MSVEEARIIDAFLEEHWFEVAVIVCLLLIAYRCGKR